MNNKQRKGIASQLLAYAFLARQPDIIVFTPLDGVGPIDIVTYNTKTKVYTNYDVKTVSLRKNQSYRCGSGTRINRSPTKIQKELNVRILYVTDDGEVYETRKRRKK